MLAITECETLPHRVRGWRNGLPLQAEKHPSFRIVIRYEGKERPRPNRYQTMWGDNHVVTAALGCPVEKARLDLRLAPTFTQIPSEAAPPFGVFEGWEPRTWKSKLVGATGQVSRYPPLQ